MRSHAAHRVESVRQDRDGDVDYRRRGNGRVCQRRRFRCPNTEVSLIWPNQLRADRITTAGWLLHPILSPISRVLVVHGSDFSFHPQIHK